MPHSHLPVQHLLKQMETFEPRRGERDVRPAWVTGFVERVAELFAPIVSEVGRVGFDCEFHEDRWVVGMYMGSTEVVGGPQDGIVRPTDFDFDVHRLLDVFESVDQFRFRGVPELEQDARASVRASVLVEGRVSANPLRLQVYAVPPTEAGPALREYPDGRCEPI